MRRTTERTGVYFGGSIATENTFGGSTTAGTTFGRSTTKEHTFGCSTIIRANYPSRESIIDGRLLFLPR